MTNLTLFLFGFICVLTLTLFAADDVCIAKGLTMTKVGKHEIACVQKP